MDVWQPNEYTMKITITGGAGFVGSNLCIHLKHAHPGYDIIAFDNLKRRGSELNLNRLRAYDIHFIHGDIRNAEDLEQIGHTDVLIDASADPSVLSGIQSPILPLINANLSGTVNALEYASRHDSVFIFLSTSRIYPVKPIESLNWKETDTRFMWTDDQHYHGISSKGITEQFTLTGSRSFYGATKLASELLISEYAEFKGLRSVINRCGVISGPWQMGKIDQGVVILWLARHFFKGKLAYIGYGGSGKQTRDVLHISDLVELIDYQIHHLDQFLSKTFNVGGGVDVSFSLQELTKLCVELTGNSIPIDRIDEKRSADLRIYIGDSSAIQSICGWTPSRNLRQLLEDSFLWMQENENTLKNILI